MLMMLDAGITRCDMIAESIIGAAKEIHLSVPIVVRLQGTNSAKGLKLVSLSYSLFVCVSFLGFM